MNILKQLIFALWQQNLEILSNPNVVWVIYLTIFIIIFLENSLLPAAFLPGDSLLVLVGVLIAKKILNFSLVILILTFAANFGSWVSFLQGKWLENNQIMKIWLTNLPKHYHYIAKKMFYRYGLSALIIGKFIVCVRTLLPIIAGLCSLKNLKFHFFNLISSFLWVFTLTLVGTIIGNTSFFHHHEKNIMLLLMALPLSLFIIGLITLFVIIWRSKNYTSNK